MKSIHQDMWWKISSIQILLETLIIGLCYMVKVFLITINVYVHVVHVCLKILHKCLNYVHYDFSDKIISSI